MELNELMRDMAQNNMPHFNIWFGEEQKIIDLYLEKVASLGYKLVYADSVRFVVDQIGRKSLDKSNKCYVVTEDTDFSKAEGRWSEIADRFIKSNHVLVCRYANINKTIKFYRQNSPHITEFKHLDTNILLNYINREIQGITTENAEDLAGRCSNDYGRILLECNKIKSYADLNKVDFNESYEMLLEDDGIYSEIGDITFKLTDAVLKGDIDNSFKYLDQANRKGEPAIMIASILYNGFRNQLAYKGLGKDKREAGKRTGLTGWQIKQCTDQSEGYSMKEAERNMLFCQGVEVGIKTGKLDFDNVLDYLVLGCLK